MLLYLYFSLCSSVVCVNFITKLGCIFFFLYFNDLGFKLTKRQLNTQPYIVTGDALCAVSLLDWQFCVDFQQCDVSF